MKICSDDSLNLPPVVSEVHPTLGQSRNHLGEGVGNELEPRLSNHLRDYQGPQHRRRRDLKHRRCLRYYCRQHQHYEGLGDSDHHQGCRLRHRRGQ
jgi:hypothetical protein